MTEIVLTVSTTNVTLKGESTAQIEVDHEAIQPVVVIPGQAKSTTKNQGDKSFIVNITGFSTVTESDITNIAEWLATNSTVAVTSDLPSPYASFNAKILRNRFIERVGTKRYMITLQLIEV